MSIVTFELHEDYYEDMGIDGEPRYSRADEFCFYIGDKESFFGEDIISIYVNPIWYWNKYGHLDDRSTATQLMNKIGFPELMESTYESTLSEEETRQKLLDAGLKENKEFSNFMKRMD